MKGRSRVWVDPSKDRGGVKRLGVIDRLGECRERTEGGKVDIDGKGGALWRGAIEGPTLHRS